MQKKIFSLLKDGKPVELSSAKCVNDSTIGWTYKTTELISSKATVHNNKYTFPAFCAVPGALPLTIIVTGLKRHDILAKWILDQ